MKVYLKNGRTIRVRQVDANMLVDMIKHPEEGDLFIQSNRFSPSKNVVMMIRTEDISAIK